MKSLLRRSLGLLRSCVDSLMAPAADPRVAFASAQQRQRELLGLARRALAELAGARGQLEARMAALQAHLPLLEDEALRALRAGREDLARMALRRRRLATAELGAIEQQATEIQQKEQLLALHEGQLAAQVDALETRLHYVAASYNAAEVQVRMSEAFGSVSEGMSDLSAALEQAEQQAARLQGHADVLEALIGGELLVRQGQPAETEALIEAEIAALKRRLAQAEAAR
jgi:phage shock protein A